MSFGRYSDMGGVRGLLMVCRFYASISSLKRGRRRASTPRQGPLRLHISLHRHMPSTRYIPVFTEYTYSLL